MEFELLPIDETMMVLRKESNPTLAFEKIIEFGREKLSSLIWDQYIKIDIDRDINDATKWIENALKDFPKSKGIYLGLNTLNMDAGNGTNIEIGLSQNCDPNEFSDDWTYDCENYGKPHLIKGLYEVSDTFKNKEKWTNEERSFAEYLIFLGYSGVVLREALNKLKTSNDFLSIWGFHDGDMFFLVQKIGDSRQIVTEIYLG